MFNKADYLAIYEEFEDKGIFEDDIEIGSFPSSRYVSEDDVPSILFEEIEQPVPKKTSQTPERPKIIMPQINQSSSWDILEKHLQESLKFVQEQKKKFESK
ncbi:hypothetical protein M9Y10_035472 [Tritrichomonas musculus]|uniref:Uncharacterized protein n=1 Tax=Tritrichomonas musculus TaxID=1915356 RepID=A0ABR2KJS4_9EUKA